MITDPVTALLTAELAVSEAISDARDAHGRRDAEGVVQACNRILSTTYAWSILLPEEVADDEPF